MTGDHSWGRRGRKERFPTCPYRAAVFKTLIAHWDRKTNLTMDWPLCFNFKHQLHKSLSIYVESFHLLLCQSVTSPHKLIRRCCLVTFVKKWTQNDWSFLQDVVIRLEYSVPNVFKWVDTTAFKIVNTLRTCSASKWHDPRKISKYQFPKYSCWSMTLKKKSPLFSLIVKVLTLSWKDNLIVYIFKKSSWEPWS